MPSQRGSLPQIIGGHTLSDTWLKMTAANLGRQIGEGNIDPVALAETYLAAADKSALSPRIYARMTKDRALPEAAAASERAKSGSRKSLLDGVPISWKDLFDTESVATEAGSALLAGRVPDRDAVVLKNATSAGLVCLGKTHMSELAFSGLGYNPVTESPPCVNDLQGVSGGSSSGAAASVAFDIAAAGIGSDTGGSVRIPAAWNDLVGLKTTSGRLSLEGVVPLCARFDTVGPLCRSVEDAAHLLAAMEGNTPTDLENVKLSAAKFLVLETKALDDVRIEPMAGFDRALKALTSAGAKIFNFKSPLAQQALELAAVLYTTEAYATWKHLIDESPEKMFPEVLQRFRAGAAFAGHEFVSAWQELERLRIEWRKVTAGYDAVIMPTSPILPPNLERLTTDSDYYVQENLLALRNTRIGNLLGLAALTVPTGVPSTGLMLASNPGSEEKLLRLGAAAEAALA